MLRKTSSIHLETSWPRHFAKKFPKLQDCKVLGARTVLVLESIDPPFWHYRYIGNHLPKLLTQRTDPPDEIYLVEPHPGEFMWCVWPVKRDEQHWPAVGMPQRGRPYFPLGQSPPQDLPTWHRHLNTPLKCGRRSRWSGPGVFQGRRTARPDAKSGKSDLVIN